VFLLPINLLKTVVFTLSNHFGSEIYKFNPCIHCLSRGGEKKNILLGRVQGRIQTEVVLEQCAWENIWT
jgi:hypothetical protein